MTDVDGRTDTKKYANSKEQTATATDRHGDSMTDPALRSKSVKIGNILDISKESNTNQFPFVYRYI